MVDIASLKCAPAEVIQPLLQLYHANLTWLTACPETSQVEVCCLKKNATSQAATSKLVLSLISIMRVPSTDIRVRDIGLKHYKCKQVSNSVFLYLLVGKKQ